MTLIQDLERQNRRKANRSLAFSTALLSMMIVLSVAVAGESKIEPSRTDPRVEQLQTKTEKQAERITDLQQLLTYCKTTGWLRDDRCQNPTESRAGTLAVSNPVRVVRETITDDDDSGDGDTTVVVRQPRSTPSSSRGSQRPDTAAKSNSGKSGDRDRGRSQKNGGGSGERDNGHGEGSTQRGRK